MKGGIGQLMKQAQQMQANMKKAQEEMASMTVTGESGGGMVRVVMTCQHRLQALEIDDTLIGDVTIGTCTRSVGCRKSFPV